MTTTSTSTAARCCRIYEAMGDVEEPPSAGSVELRHVMCRNLVCARPDLDIEAVIALMVDNHLGCIPVIDDQRRPIGVITKFDVVEQVHAFMRSEANGSPLPIDLAARTAEEVMMPLALTLHEAASVADAAMMMTEEDLHHVLVVSTTGILLGVVSSKDIVTWVAHRHDKQQIALNARGEQPTHPA